jgi:hypothetical protein
MGLTAVFGMGTGVTPSLETPGLYIQRKRMQLDVEKKVSSIKRQASKKMFEVWNL